MTVLDIRGTPMIPHRVIIAAVICTMLHGCEIFDNSGKPRRPNEYFTNDKRVQLTALATELLESNGVESVLVTKDAPQVDGTASSATIQSIVQNLRVNQFDSVNIYRSDGVVCFGHYYTGIWYWYYYESRPGALQERLKSRGAEWRLDKIRSLGNGWYLEIHNPG